MGISQKEKKNTVTSLFALVTLISHCLEENSALFWKATVIATIICTQSVSKLKTFTNGPSVKGFHLFGQQRPKLPKLIFKTLVPYHIDQ